jgi:hypothetical protein
MTVSDISEAIAIAMTHNPQAIQLMINYLPRSRYSTKQSHNLSHQDLFALFQTEIKPLLMISVEDEQSINLSQRPVQYQGSSQSMREHARHVLTPTARQRAVVLFFFEESPDVY